MSTVRKNSEDIRQFILSHIKEHPTDISKIVTKRFGITRQAVSRHLQKLTVEQVLTESGHTRNKIYRLAIMSEWTKTFPIIPALAEDVVWRNDIEPLLNNVSESVLDIWHYGFTEMFNNAIDHSAGSKITVVITKTAIDTEMFIIDDGIGIFKKIQTELNLLDQRHAVLELAKGKLSTDPKRHTGEGIFFSSRLFDYYGISSDKVYFGHEYNDPEDWILEKDRTNKGTTILMHLNNQATRTVKKIFDRYASNEDYEFNKTVVPVKLAQYENDKLISRSQAKRLLSRIEKFKTVIFDFAGVYSVGQAFADEIFRVFAIHHPEMKLAFIHANPAIKNMIKRATSGLTK